MCIRFFLCLSDIVSLILLAGSPDTTGAAVIESLRFLSKLLLLAQKGEETHHLAGLVSQVDSLGRVEQAKVIIDSIILLRVRLFMCVFFLSPLQQLEGWLRRLVLGSSSDGPSEVALNVSHLFKFVELLTTENR